MTATKVVELGWRNSSPQASLAFLPPEPLAETESAALLRFHPGSEAGDLASRVFVLRAAFNLRVRMVRSSQRPPRYEQVWEEGAMSSGAFKGLVTPIAPVAQRGGTVPACQLSLNVIFISDTPCTLQLMPPFFAESFRKWPGSIVCGRFPVYAWPRPLNCVLEWEDADREWVIKRGDPLACVMPIYEDPDIVPNLFEAKMTPQLKRHLARIDDVTSYGRNVGPMFERAARTRPPKLLERKTAPPAGVA